MALDMDERGRRWAAKDIAERPPEGSPDPEWRQVEWVLQIERDLARRLQ